MDNDKLLMMVRDIQNLLQRAAMGSASRWRNLYYRLCGIRFHGYVWMRAVEIPSNYHNIELDSCSLDRGVTLLCGGSPREGIKLKIGPGSYLNRRTFVDAIESVEIGQFVAIGPDCYITDHDHGVDPTRAPLDQEMVAKRTYIGDRAWLGAKVIVLKGVTIGQNAVIGAGSVVTRDIPAYAVAVGIPARVIRTRTPDIEQNTAISP
jgi:acetyltransferase-like isoleucine patch superfamily enzyme